MKQINDGPPVEVADEEGVMDFYPFNHESMTLGDGCRAVVDYDHWLCGYVAIPKDEIPQEWWGDYDADALQYLNIHGGITYCAVEGDWVVFGMDTGHSGDMDDPRYLDPDYVMGLVETMEAQILAYSKRIEEFRSAGRERRGVIMEEIRAKAPIEEKYSFGAMLDMLSGMRIFGEDDDKR